MKRIVQIEVEKELGFRWRAPQLLVKLKDESKVENSGKVRSLGHAPWFSTLKGVEGHAGASG